MSIIFLWQETVIVWNILSYLSISFVFSNFIYSILRFVILTKTMPFPLLWTVCLLTTWMSSTPIYTQSTPIHLVPLTMSTKLLGVSILINIWPQWNWTLSTYLLTHLSSPNSIAFIYLTHLQVAFFYLCAKFY